LLRNNAMMARPATVAPDACRDPKDIHLPGLSESARADFLISQDTPQTHNGWTGFMRQVCPIRHPRP
jgi:predicted nucleic acid-binding protein